MRIKQITDNGNVAAENRHQILSHINSGNRGWLPNNTSSEYFYNNINRTKHFQFNSNYNSSTIITGLFRNNSVQSKNVTNETSNLTAEPVCNTLYRLNNQNNPVFLNLNNTETSNLEGATENFLAPRESFLGSNVSSNTTPIDDERPFDHSDTDEMSENGSRPVPRGIVNPNYPGFQHLAHTLQDYSSNIENFYHSENDMTDDDIDLEITESTYEPELNLNETTVLCENINNNNQEDLKHSKILSSPIESKIIATSDSLAQKEIPDLLKTISENNNNIYRSEFDIACTDTDIENNFHTKDIIGDFNKEIEDEIKQLLNYNINIQDDLEELRKDIKDTLAKPIENTINNISEVVNHVIKKLVETHVDEIEHSPDKAANGTSSREVYNEISDIKQNETNAIKEMNLSRPTFLLIENNTNKIIDAFLSDGKDEITLYDNEYDTKNMSNNVENTIKQLSTELRKIIPKLDEMRERDRLWIRNKNEPTVILTDGNFNEVANSSRYTVDMKSGSNPHVLTREPVKVLSEPSAPKEQPKELAPAKKCIRSAQSNSSVRIGENVDKCDLGSFDVYNIETALPKLDLDAIENHLKAAKEAERRKRNDREEIRKRLAMGADSEEYYSMGHTDRPGKKPSLHSRLQNGAKLRPTTLSLKTSKSRSSQSLGHIELKESDFYALQATLQTEARIALAQAKELARVQMERERRSRGASPVTEMLRNSMRKANAPLAPDRRRVSRQLLTDMNVAQLQVVVNELHSQIESLNESLVQLLMARDELHMGQDSMLVDIEDLTRYLGVKAQTKKTKGSGKSGVRRLASLVHK
ncbi:probable basic-leucine zipper transcription factor S isoform X2 [Cydia strobilella]|uniref:probable basic-leucine zipper transcription factor S isoform X2 n=1 Tax=Cydia strobilella TaxID=1100964 RepID=UPI003003BEC2